MAREIKGLEGGYSGEIKCLGLPDRFIEHGPRDLLLKELGLDREGVAREALKMFQSKS
jgi:1-deoxy-D-xylulose-5-phosphate synthase